MICCSLDPVKFLFVALEGLSESEKDLVGSCFYTRGVDLNYHQLYFMSRQLFDDNYILCCPFVHRITSMNVNGHHMVRFIFLSFCQFLYLLFALL